MSDPEAVNRHLERALAEGEQQLAALEAQLVEMEFQRDVLHREVVSDIVHEQVALDQVRATLQQIRQKADALFARIEKTLDGCQERLNRL